MNIDWSKAPEGSTHFDPLDRNHLKQDGKIAMMWNLMVGWVEKGWQYPDDLSTMDRLLLRPQWTGEGLPPVGVVCEFNSCWAHAANGESWHRVVVVYASDESYVVRREQAPEGETTEICGPATMSEIARFRPIRTPEQIAAEEREEEIKLMLGLIKQWRFSMEQTPENPKQEARAAAEALHAAGYRKQPTP